ncbi:hypothetical protein B0H12DRAFT_301536 [Mycena haematopus]|nr:hypothetical protein B0H12DRAFT_301536 [Mycena haematopus]
MPALLDFSPELVAAVVDHLAPDADSLRSLCLAGNHNLLALVRPYTWRELALTVDDGRHDDSAKSRALASSLRAFCAEPTKARAVRSLNITLVGLCDVKIPAVRALLDVFPLLTNVTHASVCCTNSPVARGFPTHSHLIKLAVQHLPTLLSLRVDCCTDAWGDYTDMEDRPAPKLQHIATRFCNHEGIARLWRYCANLKVIEMEGGPAEQFWRAHAIDPKGPYQGHASYNTGLDFIFAPPRGVHGQRPLFFDTVTTINLVSDSTYDDSDACSLMHYFEDVRDSAPSPTLKQWVTTLSLGVDQFRHILRGIRSPTIQRIGITPSEAEHWLPHEFDAYLARLAPRRRGPVLRCVRVPHGPRAAVRRGIAQDTCTLLSFSWSPFSFFITCLYCTYDYDCPRTSSPRSSHTRPPSGTSTSPTLAPAPSPPSPARRTTPPLSPRCTPSPGAPQPPSASFAVTP